MRNKKLKIKRVLALISLLCAVMLAIGCAGNTGVYDENTKTVMTVGDYKISYDEYKTWYFQYVNNLDWGDDGIWETPDAPFDELKAMIEDTLRNKYAILTLADKYNIKLTNSDKKELDAWMASYISEQGGEAKFEAWLKEQGYTGKVFRENHEVYYYYDAYLRQLLYYDGTFPADDETILRDIENNFYRYTWILIPFSQGDIYSENRAKIDMAYSELEAGKDFYDVAEKYSEWTKNTKIGICATIGEKDVDIEKAALELKYGEYSSVIANDEGHCILMRLEIDKEYINSNYDDLVYQSLTRRYNEYVASFASELPITYKSYYDTLTHEMLTSK